MNFNWSNYLKTAEYMMSQARQFPDEEACYRSVTSRAYYASFGLARDYLKNHENFETSGNAHKEVREKLRAKPTTQKISNQLKQLCQYRNESDYDENLSMFPVIMAERALSLARKIVQALEQIA